MIHDTDAEQIDLLPILGTEGIRQLQRKRDMAPQQPVVKFSFFVPGLCKTAGSKRAFMRPGMKFPVVVDDCKESRDWKNQVRLWATQNLPEGFKIITGPLKLTLKFQRTRPAGHTKSDGVSLNAAGLRNRYPTVKPDVLKLARAVEDACTGIVWHDDAQIVREELWKDYSDQNGVWVEVETL